MRIVTPIVEEIKEDNPYLLIEKAARTCYRSFSKMTENSYERLLSLLIYHGHESMLEHSNFVVMTDRLIPITKYLRQTGNYISGNARAFRDLYREYEHEVVKFLAFEYPLLFSDLVEPEDLDDYILVNPRNLPLKYRLEHETMTIRFKNVPRGFTHEMVRMRSCVIHGPDPPINDISFAQESTRYVDYSKEDIDFIIPDGLNEDQRKEFVRVYGVAENAYKRLRKMGLAAQIARDVLPIGVRSELVVTATLKDWLYVIGLRTHPTAHPQMREIMGDVSDILRKKIYPEEVDAYTV